MSQFFYLFAIAGPPGAGKSTLAKALGVKSGWKVRSFGGYVREIARERGLPEEREVLQSLGAELNETLGEAGFISRVLGVPEHAHDGVILEGVRFREQWSEIQKHAKHAVLVYLDISDAVAEERLISRNRLSDSGKTYKEIIAHPMEIERAKLKDIATVVLTEDSVENLVAKLYPPQAFCPEELPA